MIPETIATFNNPPLVLLTKPFNLLFISAFYGSIALLVCELMHWRKLRWASILLLGMAAGSINEGIIAGTWYRVEGPPGYALIAGVNPAVAVGLTVFHTLMSTLLPILLVELFFLIFAIIPGLLGYGVAPGKLPGWQILPVTLMIGLFCLAITLGRSWSERAGWGQRQTLAIITGALLPAIIVSLLSPFALKTLEPLATVPMLVLLLWLAQHTKRLEEAAGPNKIGQTS